MAPASSHTPDSIHPHCQKWCVREGPYGGMEGEQKRQEPEKQPERHKELLAVEVQLKSWDFILIRIPRTSSTSMYPHGTGPLPLLPWETVKWKLLGERNGWTVTSMQASAPVTEIEWRQVLNKRLALKTEKDRKAGFEWQAAVKIGQTEFPLKLFTT